MSEPGNLYVISAPSGTGKTSLVKALVESVPSTLVSVSHTTRTKRPGEQHGLNYYFIDQVEFDRMEDTLARGQDVILEIDWQGGQQIHTLIPNSLSVFILPPSVADLYERLIKRNQDNIDIIKQRIADVRESTRHIGEYNYIVINDDFSAALNDLKIIVAAARLSQRRQIVKFSNILSDLVTAKVDEF
jgi:guanylate kinase